MKSARIWSSLLRHRWWILALVFALVATVLILSLGVIQPPDGFSTRSLLTLGLPIFVGIFIAMFGVKGIRDHLLGGEPDKPLLTLASLFAGGAVLSFVYGFAGKTGTLSQGILLVTAMAAAIAVGTLLGFLFGIPKFDYSNRLSVEAAAPGGMPGVLLATPKAPGAPTSGRYRPSTNLDDVADWLTKLIVGIGLSQVTNVGPAVTSIASAILHSCGTECAAQQGFVSAIITSGAAGGFLFGYIWTRLHYGKLAAQSDAEVLRQVEASSVVEIGVGKQREVAETAKGSEGGSFGQSVRPPVENTGTGAPVDQDDPNKGRFGGQPIVNGRALSATIERSNLGPRLYRVTMSVTSIIPTEPLRGEVIFHLHPTFLVSRVVRPVENGVASLTVTSYGAFTVGAEADHGQTRLELDLATQPDAPADFRSR